MFEPEAYVTVGRDSVETHSRKEKSDGSVMTAAGLQ